jgi:hypothetical protein
VANGDGLRLARKVEAVKRDKSVVFKLIFRKERICSDGEGAAIRNASAICFHGRCFCFRA